MITFYSKLNIVWKWLLCLIALVIGIYFTKDIYFLRMTFSVLACISFLPMMAYVLFPKSFGHFVRVSEMDSGFCFEYMDKNENIIRTENIFLDDLISYSIFDFSANTLKQKKIIFRSASHVVKIAMVNEKKARGVELQTAEILDRIVSRINAFNSQSETNFVERTPSFMAGKVMPYILAAYVLVLTFIILFKIPDVEKKIIGIILIISFAYVPIRLRNIELAEIKKSTSKPKTK